MSKVSIRSGIEVPFTLARDAMFILHGQDEKDVHGIYVGNKGDEPVCVQNLRVVFYDSGHYHLKPHDKSIHFSGDGSIHLPDHEKLNHGHEIRIYIDKEVDVFVYDHFGAERSLHFGPHLIHLMYRSDLQSWINL